MKSRFPLQRNWQGLIVALVAIVVLVGSHATAHAAITDNLVGYWNLNESVGSPRRDTVGSTTLTEGTSAGTASAAGKFGNAVSFASSTYITAPDNTAISSGDVDFTIAGWYYLDSKSTFQGILGKWDTATTREYLVAYNNAADRFIFDVSSDGSAQTAVTGSNSGALSTGTWYFVVAWHDSVANTINIQVNNGTVSSAAFSAGVFDSNSALVMGRYQGVGPFSGRLDNIGMWKRVLTAGERTSLYNAGTGIDYPFAASAPSAPQGLSGTFTSASQANLSWTAPSYGSDAITDYVIEYKLASSSTWNTFDDGVSTTPSATITGLTNGVNYNFRVSAVNNVGQGSASASAIISSILLSEDFTGTTINTTNWVEVDTSSNVQQNNTLSVANSYSAAVWGTNSITTVGSYDSSNLQISAVMTRGSDQLLVYGDPIFTSAGTKAYIIDLSTSVLGLVWEGGTLRTNVTCGTVTNGATYTMKVLTTGFQVYKDGTFQCTVTPNSSYLVDDKPVSLQSSTTASTFDDIVIAGPVPDPVIPDAPIIGTASAGDGQVTVTFTPPTTDGGSTITSYTATSSPGSITGSSTSSPIVVTGLTNGVSYTFTVTATNGVGTSQASSASNTVTPAVPATPGQVINLEAQGVNHQALLNWDAPVSGGTPTDYVIEYKLNTSATWQTFADGTSTATKTIVTGLLNNKAYDFRVYAVNTGGSGTASISTSATPAAIGAMAFVFTGESNSGGIGLNSDATTQEVASRSSVQITNLTSGAFLYENLDIGTNNLRDHTGLEAYYTTSHGFELQLANSTEAHEFPDHDQVFLTKTGQGGSKIADWAENGTYWTKFLQRTAAAKTQLASDRQWIVWLSLGINDSIANTSTSTWKSGVVAHINKIKADLPGAIIIMTEFQSMNTGYPAYNAIIEEIAAEEANVFAIDSTGAALRDSNHWSYSGLKTVTSRMVTVTKNTLGLIYPGIPTNLQATGGEGEVSLSWTAPIADGGSSITDYLIEYKGEDDTEWTTFSDSVTTTTSATVTGLGSMDYDFRVSAINTNGTGNPSATATATSVDLTAPIITDVASSPAQTSATVTWTTDESTDSQVEYGTTSSYGMMTTLDTTLTTAHSVVLPGLNASTTYYYRVISADASSNTTTSSQNTFTTRAATVTSGQSGTMGASLIAATINTCRPGDLYSIKTGKSCAIATSASGSSMPTVASYVFTRSLQMRMTGEDVRALQIYLNAHATPVALSGPGSRNNETTTFGVLTQKALATFQKAHGIAPAVGFFGPITRAWIMSNP